MSRPGALGGSFRGAGLGVATLLLAACSPAAPGSRARSITGAAAEAAVAPETNLEAGVIEGCGLGLALSPKECELVRALVLPAQLPEAAGNRSADDVRAARLGFLAFFDTHFSPLPEIRCASCHLPERAFDDGKPVSEPTPGRKGTRNSPSLLNAAWAGPFFFWDGRIDSLWSQPLGAIENVDEMDGSRLQVAHALADNPTYRTLYEEVFGPLPDLSDAVRFPPTGKPGDPWFDALSAEDRAAINLVSANFGKAIEAYLRKLATGPSPVDRFLAGEPEALDDAAKSGLTLFVTTGCIACHGGPALSDGGFHAMGATDADRGRAAGVPALLANPFNASGPFFDRGAGVLPPTVSASGEDEHAFKTPVLRNVARTAPYWHDGRYASLMDLLASGHGAELSESQRNDLMIFLLALNGSYPARPWSDWPAR